MNQFAARFAGRGGPIAGALLLMMAGTFSCTPVAATNDVASLGGNTAGGRGSISLQFINNTPFRAIFTYGTYDPQNTNFRPEFGQFIVDPDATKRLEGNTTSAVITFSGSTDGTTGVGRQVSVGGDRLIQLIKDDKLAADSSALQPGITFSAAPLDSPDAANPTGGRSDGDEALLGVNYQHDSLIVYTFSIDATQASGFRIDRAVILP